MGNTQLAESLCDKGATDITSKKISFVEKRFEAVSIYQRNEYQVY